MSGPRARMFVALDLPEPARTALAGWRDSLVAGRGELRPVAPTALHVTLVFLGWQDESAAAQIAEAAFGAAGLALVTSLATTAPVNSTIVPRSPSFLIRTHSVTVAGAAA